MNLKLLAAVVVGISLLAVSPIASRAEMNPPELNDPIIKKQQEIDAYIFEQRQDEIEEKGITVTHTGPVDGAVEIGILPYNQENADYFYQIFGENQVRVVEGQQAHTLSQTPAVASDSDLNTVDSDQTAAPLDQEAASKDQETTPLNQEAALLNQDIPEKSNPIKNPFVLAAGVIVIAGGILVAGLRKKRIEQ